MKIYNIAGGLLFSDSSESVKETVVAAIKSGADLSGADLSRAILIGADLSGVNLSGADLSGAILIGADLSEANLSGAILIGADLSEANLSGANMYGADLSGANLSGADLSGANMYGAKLPEQVDPVPIRAEICARVCAAPEALKMSHWHTCETVHCLAGWAVTLHPQGPELEAKYGANVAGALIFHACEGEVPDFYSDEQTAMQWLKRTAQ